MCSVHFTSLISCGYEKLAYCQICTLLLYQTISFPKEETGEIWNNMLRFPGVYHISACFTGGGSNLRERAVKIWLNFSYLSVWLTCAPLLPHSNRIWNSVLKISFISSSGWKPNINKTKTKLFQFCLKHSVKNRLKTCSIKVGSKWTPSLRTLQNDPKEKYRVCSV